VGRFASDGASSACTSCGPGRYSPGADRTACEPCPAGRFSSAAESGDCASCDPGLVQPADGQAACVDPTLDVVRCWKVTDKSAVRFAPVDPAVIDDEFDNTSANAVVKPAMVCVPSEYEGDPVNDPAMAQCCYKLKGPKTSAPRPRLTISDDFGTFDWEVVKSQFVCTPCSRVP